jgi:hypothetical protein
LATTHPAAAASTQLAVLILIVSAPSPPVPTISSNFGLDSEDKSTLLQASFMAMTIPAISSGVSPRARSSVNKLPTSTSSAPCKIAEKAAFVSSDVKCRSPAIKISMYGFNDDDDDDDADDDADADDDSAAAIIILVAIEEELLLLLLVVRLLLVVSPRIKVAVALGGATSKKLCETLSITNSKNKAKRWHRQICMMRADNK